MVNSDKVYERCGYTTEEFKKLPEERRIEIEQSTSFDELNAATKHFTKLYERAGAKARRDYSKERFVIANILSTALYNVDELINSTCKYGNVTSLDCISLLKEFAREQEEIYHKRK